MHPLLVVGAVWMALGVYETWQKTRAKQAEKQEKVNGQNLPANIANPVPAGGDSQVSNVAPPTSDGRPPPI